MIYIESDLLNALSTTPPWWIGNNSKCPQGKEATCPSGANIAVQYEATNLLKILTETFPVYIFIFITRDTSSNFLTYILELSIRQYNLVNAATDDPFKSISNTDLVSPARTAGLELPADLGGCLAFTVPRSASDG